MRKSGTFDASLFDGWSRELAYLIGATLTDGCVMSADYTTPRGVYRHRVVGWQVADLDWLVTLKRVMSATREIAVCVRKHGIYYELRVQGQEIVDCFARYGVFPRKTMTCRVPTDLPPEFFFHFLRGVIDGDGWIGVRGGSHLNRPGYKRLEVAIASGSEQFLLDIQAITGGKIRHSGKRGHAVYKLEFDCGKAADLLQKVYADSDGLRLERKYRKWMEFCDAGEGYLKRVA